MIAEQPPIKPAVESARGVVASGHPLASRAGAAVLEQGGNVIDAGIADCVRARRRRARRVGPRRRRPGDSVSEGHDRAGRHRIQGHDAEPRDARQPEAVHADGRSARRRTARRSPTFPASSAGLDLLYQKYGSKKVAWADLVAPAIKLADEGFILDEALPTTIAEGRDRIREVSRGREDLPARRPRAAAGDRFVNKDYAETLRMLAKEGGQSFYRGTIARRIADDMAANGGVITFEDLAQYRAMERKPLVGRYHGHLVYSVPPPAPTGLQIVETLQILDNYEPKRRRDATRRDADYFHHVIEAWRVRDGGARIADPER